MNNAIDDDGFAAFVGIDWADAKHDICLLGADSAVPESVTSRTFPTPQRKAQRRGNLARILATKNA
jgi:hypothetical protein